MDEIAEHQAFFDEADHDICLFKNQRRKTIRDDKITPAKHPNIKKLKNTSRGESVTPHVRKTRKFPGSSPTQPQMVIVMNTAKMTEATTVAMINLKFVTSSFY
jgi:hypothetical protein